jgi:glycosyltransferase involved in cell wall biosynthesis
MARVAMIVFSNYPADPRVQREAKALAESGIAVDVICLRGPNEIPVEKFGLVTAMRITRQPDNKETFLRYLFSSLRFALLAFVHFSRQSLGTRYDVLQVHNMPDFLIFAGLLHRIGGKPLVLDLHDLSVELFRSKWKSKEKTPLETLVKLGEKASCAFADRLITTSTGFRDRLIERGIKPEKIVMVLNSADDKLFNNTSKREWRPIREKAKLLYHGTVARRFGLHVAIEAVSRLQSEVPGSSLQIYGKYDPTYRRELEEMIDGFGLDNLVKLNGYVPREEIARIIEESDIGVVPYLSDPFMDLALSTKAFEYVSMGLPVVASRLPSIGHLFDDECVTYFEQANAGSLESTISLLCNNPERRKHQTHCAAESYKQISWPIMASRYTELINSIVRESR